MSKEERLSGSFQNFEILRGLNFSEAFAYKPENFSEEEKEILSEFFTNSDQRVFAIKGLTQEVSAALLSRYSRSRKSIRRVFLDEFYQPSLTVRRESGVGKGKAEEFFERVFVEFGDDSVIQMGGVHICFKDVSQIAAKAIEERRIGAAYIEKSTRYLNFGAKIEGEYQFFREPRIMASSFAQEFLEWNQSLFDSYNRHRERVKEFFLQKYPIETQIFTDRKTGEEFRYSDLDEEEKAKAQRAYQNALNARVFDTIRVFLPATTLTSLGAFFSGQAAEHGVNNMLSSAHPEVRLLGILACQEASKVVPSFLRRVLTAHGKATQDYLGDLRVKQKEEAQSWIDKIPRSFSEGKEVSLVSFFPEDIEVMIASQIIYTAQGKGHFSKEEIVNFLKEIKKKDLAKNPELSFSPTVLGIIKRSLPERGNRRHKLPRSFEHAFFEFDFKCDFGIYRDLQRHRICSIERQMLSADEIYIPEEFFEMEDVLSDYQNQAQKTRDLNQRIASVSELFDASEYVTIFGNKLRFNVLANLRELIFISELRTMESGHPHYREVVQKAVEEILNQFPFLEPFFTFVNWKKDCQLGRLNAELRTQRKLGDNSQD